MTAAARPDKSGVSNGQRAAETHRAVPSSDDPTTTSEILNYAVDRTLLLTADIAKHACARFDSAPASALHANELGAVIAGEVLAWIRRWPS